MARFIIIYEQLDNTVEVNLAGLKEFFNIGDVTTRYLLSKDVKELDLNWCDACYAIRPSSVYTLNIARVIKASGRLFISLFDDDLLNISKSSSLYWRVKYMKSCMMSSDAILTGNPQLIESYKQIAPKIKFILSQTFVLESDIQPIREVGDVIKISYVASRDHTELFETYIRPIIDDVLALSPKIELHLMGVDPDLSHIRSCNQIISHPVRSYEAYKFFMRSNHFDIGLAPLNDDDFSNKKYFRKYIDYAEFGVLGLYSNCLPYTLVVKDGYNGILVDNDVKEWKKALIYAVDNISSMKGIVRNSQNHLRSDFSLNNVRNQFWSELDPVISKKRHKCEVSYHISFYEKFVYSNRVRYNRLASHIRGDGFIKTAKLLLKRLS